MASAMCAQYQVPGSNFDNFEPDDIHSGNAQCIQPQGWHASNVVQMGMSMVVLFQDNNGHTGNCGKLENVTVIGQTSPAWVSLGEPWAYLESLAKVNEATAGTDGGISWTHRPDTMALWIKRANNGSENAYLIYYAWTGQSRGDSYMGKNKQCTSTTHYDEESDIRTTFNGNDCGTVVPATQIAEGHWINNAVYNTWTEIKVPITYLSNTAPTKMNIIISGGNYPNKRSSDVHEGSQLWFDDLRMIYSSKVHEVLLNNRKMTSFDQDTYTYTHSLGATATSIPTITLKRSGRQLDPSEYTINYGAIGDTTTITVMAEDGSSQTTYKILFTTALSTNSKLGDITIDGTSISNFNPLIFNYNIALPFGTTTYPTIGYTLGESGQTVNVNTPQTFPGTVSLTCTAVDASYQSTYNLNFTVAPLTDNTLTDIKVNGKTITGFNPTKNTYVVELPMGTTTDPVITYTTAYPDDHDIVVTNNGLAGGATITVTPRGTTNTRTYRLTFRVTASTYSYLQSLMLDGNEIEGFDPEIFAYYDTLPIGTTTLPAITWVTGDEYQTVALEAGGVEGTSKVTVTSQSGAVSIYRIHFTVLKSNNCSLNSIKLDGTEIEGFDPNVTSYTVNLPLGSTSVPVITWIVGDQWQNVTFSDGGLTGTSRIIVRAGNGATKTYQINFVTSQSSNSKLASLKIDGVEIDGWNPDTLTYNIRLPRGTSAQPVVTWETGDQFQTVRKTDGGVNGDTRITVKAQNGQSTIYIVRFSVETNSNTALEAIFVGGVEVDNFDPDTLEYQLTLPGGTTVLPAISYTKGDESQTVAVSRGGLNGETTITVRAEDGSSRVYRLTFSVQKSANALLNGIYADSVLIAGFDAQTLSYDLTVPMSATSCPVITVDKNDGQQVTITVPAIVGLVKISVTPETGEKNVYTINIHYPQSSNTSLNGITIDGVALSTFNATQHSYSIPWTNDELPEVEGIAGDEAQTVHTTYDLQAMKAVINVKAESGDTAIYAICFTTTKGSVSTLESITLDNSPLVGFNKNATDYNITLTKSQTIAPEIGYTLTDTNASVILTVPAREGEATIAVTSADGSNTTTYKISMAVAKASNGRLSKVLKDGVEIPQSMFVNDTATIALAHGATAPEITYERGDQYQHVIMANGGINGTEIMVISEDESEVSRYVIRYDQAKSSNALLSDLNITGFNPATTTYNIVLPWRTRKQPTLVATPGDAGQSIMVNYGGINGQTQIIVTAEDGITTTTYTINYAVKKSGENYLENIYYNGTAIPAYDRDKLHYTIAIPAGTTAAPKLTWDLAMAADGSDIVEQMVEYIEAPIDKTSYIKVTAEDSTERQYEFKWKIEETEAENLLMALYVGENAVSGFDPHTLQYNIGLPAGTAELPTISYVKMFGSQSVEIMSDGPDGKTLIMVHSNRLIDEVTTYVINFEVLTVSGAVLTGISLDDVPMTRFNSGQTSYIVPITDVAPEVTFTAATGYTANIVEEDSKKCIIEVTNGDETETYALYYYYENDVIPNQNFYNWEGAAHKGSKPIGWDTPGNRTGCYKWTFLETCPGSEVSSLGGTEGGVILATTRNGDANSIYGSIPGFITTGSISMSLGSNGSSTSSVSGNIPFRNTPQSLYVNYNPIENNNNRMSNWRMYVDMNDGTNTVQSLYEGSFANMNTWQEAILPINYSGLGAIQNMNIVLNSGHSENANSYGGITKYITTVQFKNLHFIYNHSLSQLMVDGEPVSGFSNNNDTYNITLPAEYRGRPKVTCTGEVQDQEHQITYTPWSNNQMTATVKVIGEDGEQSSVYYIHFTRANSTDNTLSSIKIDGSALTGFTPAVKRYIYTLDEGEIRMPDIEAVKNFGSATASIEKTDSSYRITVIAEDSTQSLYEVIVRKANSSNADLQSITYNEEIGTYDPWPTIEFTKGDANQTVEVKRDEVVVTAADNVTTRRYPLNITRAGKDTSKILNSITINDEPLSGFASGVHQYSYETTGSALITIGYEGYGDGDNIQMSQKSDTIRINVSGTDYVVALNRLLSDNNKLTYIRRDGTLIPGFNDALYDYNVTMDRGEAVEMSIKADCEMSLSQTVSNSISEGNGITITAKAENGNEQQTNVLLDIPEDTLTTLSGIYINGEMLARYSDNYTSNSAFRSNVTDYDIVLLSDDPKMKEPEMPEITASGRSYGQTIAIEKGSVNGTTTITVTAENGSEQVYTLNISTEKSRNTMLADLAINNTTLAGFNPSSNNYVYNLSSAAEQPEITYTPGDAFQTVSVNQYASHAEVIVTAESGIIRTYSITYTVVKSTNANINNLLADGEAIEGFSPMTSNYEIELPIGTTVAPTVTVVAGDDGQSITINEGNLNTPTSIVVTAEDGSTTKFYTVTFKVEKSTVSTLDMIYVNGAELDDFNPAVNNYSITLPVGEDNMPIVTYDLGEEYQSVRVSTDEENLIASINVTAENGDAKTYLLTFHQQSSHYALLNGIYIDGDTLTGFAPTTYDYTIDLPVGTTRVPDILWIEGDTYQNILYTAADNTDGKAIIEVTAGDGVVKARYTFQFNRLRSDNKELQEISINGTPIAGFNSNIYNYIDTLGAYESTLPIVEFQPGDAYQTFDTIPALVIGGSYSIIVHAEDMSTATYTITFVRTLSNNASLSSIEVNGEAIVGFDPEQTEYVYEIPYGISSIPSVSYEMSEPSRQSAVKTNAASINDTTFITVTAEDGKTSRRYSVSFRQSLCDNADLVAIYLDSTLIEGFKSDIYSYAVELPYGTSALPEIGYETRYPDYHSVDVDTTAGVNGTTKITIVSEDEMNINEYEILFSVKPCSNSLLADLQLKDSMLTGFDPETYDYDITYPQGTDTASLPQVGDVIFVKGDMTQTVTIQQTHPTELLVTVRAADSVTYSFYQINMHIYQSDNCLLKDITVNGKSIEGFNPAIEDYTYLIYKGGEIPVIEGIASDSTTQTVEVTMGFANEESFIFVTAEDGSEKIYSVTIAESKINTAVAPWENEVSFVPLGGGDFKVTSMRDGVFVSVSTLDGKTVISQQKVELIDANDNIKDEHHGGGTILHFEKLNTYYIYTIYYDGKILKAGKFLY